MKASLLISGLFGGIYLAKICVAIMPEPDAFSKLLLSLHTSKINYSEFISRKCKSCIINYKCYKAKKFISNGIVKFSFITFVYKKP